MNTNLKLSEEAIRKSLATYLGVEIEDIQTDDSLEADLHMKPSDISDFAELLKSEYPDIHDIDLTQVETLGDLIEIVTENEF